MSGYLPPILPEEELEYDVIVGMLEDMAYEAGRNIMDLLFRLGNEVEYYMSRGDANKLYQALDNRLNEIHEAFIELARGVKQYLAMLGLEYRGDLQSELWLYFTDRTNYGQTVLPVLELLRQASLEQDKQVFEHMLVEAYELILEFVDLVTRKDVKKLIMDALHDYVLVPLAHAIKLGLFKY